MGIQGLLPFLKSIQRESHIKQWSGRTLAIDGYVWLHRGAYFCAQELCLGKPTRKHVDYFAQKIKLLTQHGITPFVVFDGDHLPSKKTTEHERENRRRTALANANRFLAQGDQQRAREEFVKAVDVTPQLAHDVILALRSTGIQYVVAPYEADAQLRYLEMKGHVDGIITEDSDLLVYGARNVLFKLDSVGNCIHICRDHFGLVDDKRMSLWTDREFRQMAMLSGCDYLASIPGLGLKKAHELIRRFKTAERAIKATRLDGKLNVPLKYEQHFREAELTFLHQFVYDSTIRSMLPLNPLPESPPSMESLAGCGEKWPDQIAIDVAEGRLDPLTKVAFSHNSSAIEPLPLQAQSLNQPAPKPSSQKRLAVSSTNQPTLNKFVFKLPPSNSKSNSLSLKEPSSNLSKPSSNHDNSKQYHTVELLNDKPSKFFGSTSIGSAESSCPISPELPDLDSQDFFGTQTTIDELQAEDALPLTQDNWEAISEVSSDRSVPEQIADLSRDLAFEELMGDDLPSSQMHDPPNPSLISTSRLEANLQTAQSPFDGCSAISGESTQEIRKQLDLSLKCPMQSQEIENQYTTNFSDGFISSSEPDQSQPAIKKPIVTIITPQNPSISSLLLNGRRLSEPIPRRMNQAPISSDPIVSSDEDQKDVTKGEMSISNRRKASVASRSEQPCKKSCRGFVETPSNYLSKVVRRANSSLSSKTPTAKRFDDDEVSPSLARIATGIRNRFMYQKPGLQRSTTHLQTPPNLEPKLFDFSKKHDQGCYANNKNNEETNQLTRRSLSLSHPNQISSTGNSSSIHEHLNRSGRKQNSKVGAFCEQKLDSDANVNDYDYDEGFEMDYDLKLMNRSKKMKSSDQHINPSDPLSTSTNTHSNSINLLPPHPSRSSTPNTNQKLSRFLFKGNIENYLNSSTI